MGIYYLCLFAFVAGFVDAVAGGGGLIQLPAFFILQPELSLVQTLATNKTASFLGTATATMHYVGKAHLAVKHLLPAMITAAIGSFCGALLVSHLSKGQFMPFIIVALIAVLIYTLIRKNLGLNHEPKELKSNQVYIYGIITGTVIGFYDGVIGPGTGSFLIFAFIIVYGYDFLHASVSAKLLNCITNLAALILFMVQGNIIWKIALPVGACNMAGNYIGARVALKRGSRFVKIFFITVVCCLIVKLAYSYL
ncbi:MAG: TSUP family transporter [Taibaiella sp.]|nr:TSUP family transporter [Taibaiella sp.]